MNVFPFKLYGARSLWIPVREPKFTWHYVDALITSKSEIEFIVYGFYEKQWSPEKEYTFKRTICESRLAPYIDRQIKRMAVELIERKAAALRQAEITEVYKALKETLANQ